MVPSDELQEQTATGIVKQSAASWGKFAAVAGTLDKEHRWRAGRWSVRAGQLRSRQDHDAEGRVAIAS